MHGTIISELVIILLLVCELSLKRQADRRENALLGSLSSAAVKILLLFEGGGWVNRQAESVEALCMEQ